MKDGNVRDFLIENKGNTVTLDLYSNSHWYRSCVTTIVKVDYLGRLEMVLLSKPKKVKNNQFAGDGWYPLSNVISK